MFRVLELDQGGSVQRFEGPERVGPPPPGTRRWIDVDGPDASAIELFGERFKFHALALEDCAHFDQRPKLEEFGDHLFLVTQSFTSPGARVKKLELHELHAFLGENYLVTVHADAIPALEEVWQRAARDPAPLHRGLDFIYYLAADSLVDGNFAVLDRVADELESLEDQVLQEPERRQLARVFALKRQLSTMRKALSPQRDTMAMLARRGDPRVSEKTAFYFRDVYDHLVRNVESIDANREQLANVLDAYLSSVSNHTNEVMKSLTLLNAVFLPLTFVVGFFGQNFRDLPGFPEWVSSQTLMLLMITLCVGLPSAMLLWFRQKGWF